jgi:hypothetical protein
MFMKKMLILSALALMTASVYGDAQVAAASVQKTVPAQPQPAPTPDDDEDVIIMEEDDTDPSDEDQDPDQN